MAKRRPPRSATRPAAASPAVTLPRPRWVGPAATIALVLATALVSYAAVRSARRSVGASPANATAVPPKKPADDESAPRTNPDPPPGPAPEGMVWIPGGRFWMGSDDPATRDARPVHAVELDGYWIDRTEVTNAAFARFVAATGYKTVAEQPPDPKLFPGAPAELLVPGSVVFNPPDRDIPLDNALVWWRYQPGADWRHPDGPGSSIEGRDNHPVVQVCWDDAVAYSRWAGKRLPTEAEWEYTARGGLDRKRYTWGDEPASAGTPLCNNWQGRFPATNTAEDGYTATAPVGSFPPNGYGLVDMAGNVWEWCADWYRPDAYTLSTRSNPLGPASSFDPAEPGVAKRVQRGGSYMCSDQYCTRYLPGARGKGAVDSGAPHVGFRCVISPPRDGGPGR